MSTRALPSAGTSERLFFSTLDYRLFGRSDNPSRGESLDFAKMIIRWRDGAIASASGRSATWLLRGDLTRPRLTGGLAILYDEARRH